MKIILLQDVAKIGRKHQVVEVPDGYARNQLIPKGNAKPATPENLKAINKLHQDHSKASAAEEEKFFAAKEALKDKVITLSGLKNDNGHLFAAIKPEMIHEALIANGINVDVKAIKLPGAIKTTGEHQIELTHSKHSFNFTIAIE